MDENRMQKNQEFTATACTMNSSRTK